MTHTELKSGVMELLKQAQKPLTEDTALSMAKDFLLANNASKEAREFEAWFHQNGLNLLKALNGA